RSGRGPLVLGVASSAFDRLAGGLGVFADALNGVAGGGGQSCSSDGQNDEFAHRRLLLVRAPRPSSIQRYAWGAVPLRRKAATSRTWAASRASGVTKVSRAIKPPPGAGTIRASPRSCLAKAIIRVRPTPASMASSRPGPS